MQTQRSFLFSTAPPLTAAASARPAAVCGAELPWPASSAAMRSGHRACGFTMLELMVVVAIAGILAAMAAPAMMEVIRSNRLSAIARQLEADLLLARREAIKRNTRVLVCPVGTTAGKCGSGTTAWAQGWLVCYDADQNGDCDDTATSNPNPIKSHGVIETALTLTGPAGVARFNANGTQGAAGAGALTFTTKGAWTGSKSYVESVSATGNISMAAGS